jgi:hypothetical protein
MRVHYYLYVIDGLFVCLFVCKLFNHVVSTSHFVELSDQITVNVEGNGQIYVTVPKFA